MTVRELIKQLQQVDQDLVVVREFDFEGPYIEITHVDIPEQLQVPHRNPKLHDPGDAMFFCRPQDWDRVGHGPRPPRATAVAKLY